MRVQLFALQGLLIIIVIVIILTLAHLALAHLALALLALALLGIVLFTGILPVGAAVIPGLGLMVFGVVRLLLRGCLLPARKESEHETDGYKLQQISASVTYDRSHRSCYPCHLG